MLKIRSEDMKTPSSFQWDLEDLSSEGSERTLDGISHKDLIRQVRKLTCTWVGLTKSEASKLLKQVNQTVNFPLTYPDTMSGMDETRTFYVGPRSAGMQQYQIGNILYSSVSFNFIEK